MRHNRFNPAQARKRIKKRVDFLETKGRARDKSGHGTYCAGLLHMIAPWADIYVGRVTDGRDLDANIMAQVSVEYASRTLRVLTQLP